MKHPSTYRRCLSAALLILYVFIITPVQLWHHHCPVVKEIAGKVNASKAVFAVQAPECKICQHTYAVGINDAAVIKLSTQVLYADVNAVLYFHYKFISSASPDNKGPPVV